MLLKISKKKSNILNYIFCQLKFVVCFAPLSREVKRDIILDHGSTADSVKPKRGSGDTPTGRVCLCEVQHVSVVGAQ